MKMGMPDVPNYEMYLSNLPNGSIVACDPTLFGANSWINLRDSLKKSNIELKSIRQNLIDLIWTPENGRPPLEVKFGFSNFNLQRC